MKTLTPLLLACVSCATSAQERSVRTYGYAYDLETDRYAYTEVSDDRMAGDTWLGGTITYFWPDGREFARKTVTPGKDKLVPLYRLESSGYIESITDNGDTIAMSRGDESGALKRDGLMAADQGLADLLLAHLDELTRGETVKFRIVTPSRLDSYKFRAHRVADMVFESRTAVQIQVDLDSLFKLFAGPLTFAFDAASRKLVEFRGISGLTNPANGKAYTVRLDYPSARPRDAPALPP